MRATSTPGGMSHRLEPQPGEELDRSTKIEFAWNGDAYTAYRGDTVVSALAAHGKRVFGRSFKYHRPRGILTADFHDPNCMMQVDGEPNVRAAHRLVTPGMRARSQNGWPSIDRDILAANELLKPFLGPGFYYKTFMKPRSLRPLYRRVLRQFSPGGAIQDAPVGEYFDKRFAFHDVVVAGGGPAGMSAAVSAADQGAHVLLVDDQHHLGGHLRWGSGSTLEVLESLRTEVRARDGIEVLTDAVVVGRYDHNWVAVLQRRSPTGRERLIKGRPGALVVAPGLIERPYIFDGNDVPGVMLSTAVRRLVNLYAVAPGRRALVFSANATGDAAADDLERIGLDVVRIDARDDVDILRARGRSNLDSVELTDGRRFDVDLLVTAVGWTAPTALLNMAGDRPRYEPRAARFVPAAEPSLDVLATGGVVGDGSTDQICAHGDAVGARAAQRALGGSTPAAADGVPELPLAEHPELFHGATHGIVDFSEDVHSKDLQRAVDEGYDSIELSKRYTTATMGPVQGKLSVVNAVAVHAERTGQTIDETGTTTWRPPYAPISLGALAGRRFAPIRRTPMHDWHEERNASFFYAGSWLRPEHYGDPQQEVANVRSGVGIIDVSTLGKMDLRGPDVPKLLELLYVNKWSKLAVGKVRYGAMCNEEGVVLDDGVTGHLDDHRYIMSTTSSGSDRVHRWIENWMQTERPDWRVHVTNLTDAYASMNVAGPRSRVLLERVAEDVDLSNDAFPYMNVREARIAGVDGCFMWRIGFTGELSYELHVPAGYGLHVWEALFSAGDDLGVAPFGVEAQRTMRIEKGHAVVGQDTDSLTGPYAAGMSWAVKTDKEDFVGKPELLWQAEHTDELPRRLVGLRFDDPEVVPAESCQLLEDGRIVGRITSSRRSPTLGRAVVLAQLEPRLSDAGTEVRVRLVDGRAVTARVTDQLAQIDPDGDRLRG